VSRHFDAIIIGTGQAGPSLAAWFTAAGMTVAIIERHKFGGTCVNTGCIPTKTLVASAYAAHVARRGAEYGFAVNGDVRVDMKRVKARRMKYPDGRRESWRTDCESSNIVRSSKARLAFSRPTLLWSTMTSCKLTKFSSTLADAALFPRCRGFRMSHFSQTHQ
jgi:pyruvate/2-oxoglutarate dehydrogenase complex dihydrolipoamide dehydrogenase (E3) component